MPYLKNGTVQLTRVEKQKRELDERFTTLKVEEEKAWELLETVPDDIFLEKQDQVSSYYHEWKSYLIDCLNALKYPVVRNKWFLGIVSEMGEGEHWISLSQYQCFSQYFENNHHSYDLFCNAAGYFCTLCKVGYRYKLKIEKFVEPTLEKPF